MKKGITLVSIIIYMVLFFTFTVFAISVSSNLNRNVLMDKGSAEIEEEYSKLYINMFSSAKNSNSYNISSKSEGKVISFSNGDSYLFDVYKGYVYKNEGILCRDLNQANIIESTELVGTTLTQNVLSNLNSLCLNVSFGKYSQILEREIVVTVGDEQK